DRNLSESAGRWAELIVSLDDDNVQLRIITNRDGFAPDVFPVRHSIKLAEKGRDFLPQRHRQGFYPVSKPLWIAAPSLADVALPFIGDNVRVKRHHPALRAVFSDDRDRADVLVRETAQVMGQPDARRVLALALAGAALHLQVHLVDHAQARGA